MTVETLPAVMISQLETLGTALLAVARQERDATLKTLEHAVLESVRTVLPRLLEVVLQLGTTELQPRLTALRQDCPNCRTRAKAQSWRPRTVNTVCGPITFERPWYVCPRCRKGFSPVDQTLQLEAGGRLSEGLKEWLTGLGATTSFAEAAHWLKELAGLAVSAETVRQHTERKGQEIELAQEAASEQVARTREPAGALDRAPGKLVVETDGVKVRYLDGFHEVKIGLVGGHEGGKLGSTSYVACRLSSEAFGPRLAAEAARRGALEIVGWEGPVVGRGLAVLREVVVLGDGAVWIWNLADEHFGERVEIVDFYHASEHVWEVARALHGEGSEEAKAWAGERIKELLKDGVEPVRKALSEAKGETAEQAEVLRVERGYFQTNAHRMDYPTYRAQGLPIGSGAVEGSAKYLVKQRMKRAGARWSAAGAQAVLNVRCYLLSDLPLAS